MIPAFSHLREYRDSLGKIIKDKNTDPRACLGPKEFEQLCEFVYKNLDDNHDGKIEMREYIDAATGNELLEVEQVARFFDIDRRRGCWETLFGVQPVENIAKIVKAEREKQMRKDHEAR